MGIVRSATRLWNQALRKKRYIAPVSEKYAKEIEGNTASAQASIPTGYKGKRRPEAAREL